jgi:hypothetical protein
MLLFSLRLVVSEEQIVSFFNVSSIMQTVSTRHWCVYKITRRVEQKYCHFGIKCTLISLRGNSS